MAGGLGKRMNSIIPKVLHVIDNKPLIVHVLNTALELNPNKILIVVGKYHAIIQNAINNFIPKDKQKNLFKYIYQESAKGTGHAIMCCVNYLSNIRSLTQNVIILSGDVPY